MSCPFYSPPSICQVQVTAHPVPSTIEVTARMSSPCWTADSPQTLPLCMRVGHPRAFVCALGRVNHHCAG